MLERATRRVECGDVPQQRRTHARGVSKSRRSHHQARKCGCQAYGTAQLAVKAARKSVGAGAAQIMAGGQVRAVQGNGNAVAGERRNDGGLVAHPPQARLRVRHQQAIRNGRKRQRFQQQRLGSIEPRGQGVAGAQQMGEQRGPPMFAGGESPAVDEQAKIGRAIFSELEAGVAAGKEKELDPATKRALLRGRKTKMHFEGDETVLRAGRAAMAGEIVLAGGQKDVGGAAAFPAGEPRIPHGAGLH